MAGGFRHGHIFAVSAVDARDDGVPPGEGGHGVEGVVALSGEAQRAQLEQLQEEARREQSNVQAAKKEL